jgi:hypothetical protein
MMSPKYCTRLGAQTRLLVPKDTYSGICSCLFQTVYLFPGLLRLQPHCCISQSSFLGCTKRGLQLGSVFVINVLGNDETWSMCSRHNKFLNSHLKCQRFLCVHVSSSCNTVLPPVAIQWRVGLAQMSVSSEGKQLQFTRLHTNCSVIVKLFYLLILLCQSCFWFLSHCLNVSRV